MRGLLPLPLPLPSRQQSPFIFCIHHSNPVAPPQLHVSSIHHQRLDHFIRPSAASSSSSTDSLTQSVQQVDGDVTPDQVVLPLSGCKACGREEIESGCNGEGRIQGGIATIPGFGWWPIKAYRPCPGFLASGGNYRRRGQSMDEVAFGGGKQASSIDDSAKRKKGQDEKRLKR